MKDTLPDPADFADYPPEAYWMIGIFWAILIFWLIHNIFFTKNK